MVAGQSCCKLQKFTFFSSVSFKIFSRFKNHLSQYDFSKFAIYLAGFWSFGSALYLVENQGNK